MTVSELIEKLQKLPQNFKICVYPNDGQELGDFEAQEVRLYENDKEVWVE